jgi:hypothetical protein
MVVLAEGLAQLPERGSDPFLVGPAPLVTTVEFPHGLAEGSRQTRFGAGLLLRAKFAVADHRPGLAFQKSVKPEVEVLALTRCTSECS